MHRETLACLFVRLVVDVFVFVCQAVFSIHFCSKHLNMDVFESTFIDFADFCVDGC